MAESLSELFYIVVLAGLAGDPTTFNPSYLVTFNTSPVSLLASQFPAFISPPTSFT